MSSEASSFWDAYRELRRVYPLSAVELAYLLKTSFSSVYSWDIRAKKPDNAHGRTPNRSNRLRLAEIARSAGCRLEVIQGLQPPNALEARA